MCVSEDLWDPAQATHPPGVLLRGSLAPTTPGSRERAHPQTGQSGKNKPVDFLPGQGRFYHCRKLHLNSGCVDS